MKSIAASTLKLTTNGRDITQPKSACVSSPKSPVLAWIDFVRTRFPHAPAVHEHPSAILTSSGRASLLLALEMVGLAADDLVAVPTYHCPTMVAPVLLAGGQPIFYGLDGDAQPRLDELAHRLAGRRLRAVIVPHLFGLPRDLSAARRWCDQMGVMLIEDCAHTFLGHAGNRPVGTWGDYATASVTKFLPVPEAGILVAPHGNGPGTSMPGLESWSLGAQAKAVFQVLEKSLLHRRLGGLAHLVWPLHWGRSLMHNRSLAAVPAYSAPPAPTAAPEPTVEQAIVACDMGRSHRHATWVARFLTRTLPLGAAAAARRRHFEYYRTRLSGLPAIRPLWDTPPPADGAPYVMPLLIEDADFADELYHRLRISGHAVFRWDRLWPGTPPLESDCGRAWSRQVIQLLTHQSLDSGNVEDTAQCISNAAAGAGG